MAHVEWTDEELVRRVLEGDNPAFGHIVEKYRDRVYAICYGHLLEREEAKDLVQDVFVQAYKKLDTLRNWSRLGPFLAAIAQNYSKNRYKRQKRYRALQDSMEQQRTLEEQLSAQELSATERNDLHAVLRVLVKTLPASSREVVLLHYFEEMSTSEIADFLGIRQPAVLQRLHYGRKLLRTRMERELKPALEHEEERKKHIHAILAAVPFGNAPWTGQPVPVKPMSAGDIQRLRALKAGVAGGGLIAAAGFVAWWFGLATLNQPNPPVQDTVSEPIAVVRETATVTPDLSDRVGATPPAGQSASAPALSPLSVPAAKPARGTIELVFGPPPWNLSETNRASLRALAEAYTAETPGVTVRLAPDWPTAEPWSLEPDHVGDVFLDETIRTGGSALLARLRSVGALAELGTYIEKSGFDFDDFYANVQDLVRTDEGVWGVPFFTASWAFALPPRLEETPWIARHLREWDQFPDVLSALWLEPLDGGTRTSVAVVEADVVWSCLFMSSGGDLNDVATLRQGGAPERRAMTRFQRCFDQNQPAFRPAGPQFEGDATGYAGSFAMVTDLPVGAYSLADLRRKNSPVALIPAPGRGPLAPIHTQVLAVKRSNPERERAAWEFVAWLTSPAMLERMYLESGMLPLRTSLRHVVASDEDRLLLDQIGRMQFQRPDLECVRAYSQLREAFLTELRRQFAAYQTTRLAAMR